MPSPDISPDKHLMILIGSQAARLCGHFPDWRDPDQKSDFDFVSEPAEAIELSRNLGCGLVERPFGPAILYRGQTLDLSFIPATTYSLMARLCNEPMEINLAGTPIVTQVAPLPVIWATLVLTAGCARAHHHKSFLDLDFYQRAVDRVGGLTDDHFDLALAFREISVARTIQNLKQRMGAS